MIKILLLFLFSSCIPQIVGKDRLSLKVVPKTTTASLSSFSDSLTYNNSALYTPSSVSNLEFVSGLVRLTKSSQQYNNQASFDLGTNAGTQYDSTNGLLRLNTLKNNSTFDSSTLPRWNNLMGYWKMENDWSDSGPNGYSATPAVSATFGSSQSRIGNYYGVFGTTTSNVKLGTFDNVSNNLSISFWYNWYGVNGGAQVLLAKRFGGNWGSSSTDVKWQVNIGNDSNGVLMFYNAATGLVPEIFNYSFGQNPGWSHIVLTQNGTNGIIHLYVNGALFYTSSTSSTNGLAINAPIMVGGLDGGGEPFNGALDDVAIWDYELSASEVSQIAEFQRPTYTAKYTSEVMDAKSIQSWTDLVAKTTLPFGKPILGSGLNDSSSDYTSLVGNWGSGLVHYIGFDGTFTAQVGTGPTYTPVSGGYSFSTGQIGQAVTIDTLSTGSDRLAIPNGNFPEFTNATDSFTYSLLVKKDISYKQTSFDLIFYMGWGMTNDMCLLKTTSVGNDGAGFDGRFEFHTGKGASYNLVSTSRLGIGKWNHIVITQDGTNRYLYLNGVLEATALAGPCVSGGTNMQFMSADGDKAFRGSMDEFATWNRSLTSTEIKELYRRYTNQIKYQIRSCANADCSDQEALVNAGKGWKGPTGNQQSYFSELHNNTSIDASANPIGTTKSTGLNLLFSNFTSAGLASISSQYFQFRAFLSSYDSNNLCDYGVGAVPCSPEVKTISIGPDHYSKGETVVTNTPTDFAQISSFTQVLGGSGPAGSGVTYQVSHDNSNWRYWNGSTWATASTSAQSNSASIINTNASAVSAGLGSSRNSSLYIKAFLNSDGLTPCELDSLLFGGLKY